ncbi:MAG: Maf family protein [Myxococcota bacterium]|nr:Maf family protein [Myxococcota bacterium]
MKPYEPLVLASASPRRRQLLSALGLIFDVIPAAIDETRMPDEFPAMFTERMAKEKGRAVTAMLDRARRRPWIVAADTVVVCEDQIMGKPKDKTEAAQMLKRLAGQTHVVITGWTVGRSAGPWIVESTKTDVTFFDLQDDQISAYAATGEGMDKAGAYAIQGMGAFLVDRIHGSYTNVVGLPVSHVVRALITVGALPTFPIP